MSSSSQNSDRGGVLDRIRQVALDLFTERGYHGTPIRAIARSVGMEAASLYYHFPSKQQILRSIFDRTMDDLLEGLDRVMANNTTIEDKLRALVRFHVLFHIERQAEAFLSHSELRSLTEDNRRLITARRDLYEAALRDLISAGVAAGVFHTPDVRLTTIAVLMMCSGVSDWFAAGGRLSSDDVVEAYTEMVFRLLGAAGAPADSKHPAAGSTGLPAAQHGDDTATGAHPARRAPLRERGGIAPA